MENQHTRPLTLSTFTLFAIIPLLTLIAALNPTTCDRTQACLWDSDTLYMEAKGLGSLTEVITGRFDRFPPLYYQMRLDRISSLDATSLTLNDYDDAAVACDRLGKGDDAIAWMARKAAALASADPTNADTADHQYRYLANLGTFHAHRWLRTGTNRTNLTDLATARDLIAAAIDLNPDAHFGRERYQLLAIEWLLDPPASEYGELPTIFDTTDQELRPRYVSGNLERNGYQDASSGLAGLIVLGNAWESTDIFNALAEALVDEGKPAIGYLAELRMAELEKEGRVTLYPNQDTLPDADFYRRRSHTVGYVLRQIDAYFPRARKEAESWRAARNAFIRTKLEVGLHPDTNVEFWSDWKEPSRPPSLPGKFSRTQIIAWTLAIIMGGLILLRFLKAHRRNRNAVETDQQSLVLPT